MAGTQEVAMAMRRAPVDHSCDGRSCGRRMPTIRSASHSA
jgi:hypothetical protein